RRAVAGAIRRSRLRHAHRAAGDRRRRPPARRGSDSAWRRQLRELRAGRHLDVGNDLSPWTPRRPVRRPRLRRHRQNAAAQIRTFDVAVEAFMNHAVTERRLMRRLEDVEQHRIIATRIRPGHLARIVDVSGGGALIETMYRLLPGTSVELHVETHTRHTRVRGEVLRCAVIKVRPDSVCYRGAIRFDRHLPWFVDEPAASSPEARPAHPLRARSTPEAM